MILSGTSGNFQNQSNRAIIVTRTQISCAEQSWVLFDARIFFAREKSTRESMTHAQET